MKAKGTIKAKILPKGDQPLCEWLESMQFKFEMIMEEEKGLKEIEAKVKKDQDREYELLRGLHKDSQTSGQGKRIIGITFMQMNFNYIDSLIGMFCCHQNRVSKL